MPLNKKIEASLKFMPESSQGVCMDLSKEEFLDYHSLATLIKKTSFLDSLLLPKIKKQDAEEIFEILNDVTIENSTLTQIKLNLTHLDEIPDKIALINQQIQSRLERNKKRIFSIHGGGYIGLGLMADIISQSPYNYNIFATSSDKFTNLLINSINRFWIQHGFSKENDVTCIENISMIYSRNSDNIKKLYVHSNIMAICLTEEGVIHSAKYIAEGLIARHEKDQAGLKIFVLMNKPDCANFVRTLVTTEILKQTNSIQCCEAILRAIEFVPTMVDRIVNKIDMQIVMQQFRDQLNKCIPRLSAKKLIDINHDIMEQIETILLSPRKLIKVVKKLGLQFNLFNTELSFVLYAPEGLPEVYRIPAIKAVKNLDQFIMLKNKYINGPHAILAWLGGLMGYRTIAEASRNSWIVNYIENMMDYEIAPILKAENPSLSKSQFDFLKTTFLNHCKKNKKDSIFRVGRDPLRKIIRGGCITGVIDLCKTNHLQIPTPGLECGIAAAILYALKNIAPSNHECQKIRALFKKSNSYIDILCYKGVYGNGCYPGLDINQDEILIQNILIQIKKLDQLIYENNSKYSPEGKFARNRNLNKTS